MTLNENTYGNSNKALERRLGDPIYDLSDPGFAQKLNFQPHKPGEGYLDNCKKIPRFHGFKTLSQADMKERKRVQVPEWEFQGRGHPFGGGTEAIPIPIYKGSILEKRQQSLTGKETFDGKLSGAEENSIALAYRCRRHQADSRSVRDIHHVGGE